MREAHMIDLVIEARSRDLGGFTVGRVLPFAKRRSVGPFVFFDHFGPLDMPAGIPRSVDVRPHPHIGLSTLSYLFEGEIMHRDSLGSEQAIRPGEVNWMTAGRGITHSERFERARAEGGPMHGIQAWVGLPVEHEEVEPSFAHYASDVLPTYESGGLWARLVAGEAFGARAKVATYSPLFYVHWELQPEARAQLPAEYSERAAFVARGAVEVDGTRASAGQMLVFAPGAPITFTASTQSTVMLLGGEPIGERYLEWNFVSSSKARIEQAKADWRAGRMKLPVHDDAEFIPLPNDPPPPPNPMS
jgi:redox-sensitive bicupin YhaK (pirin superfamily)